jgi:hypothetical protein
MTDNEKAAAGVAAAVAVVALIVLAPGDGPKSVLAAAAWPDGGKPAQVDCKWTTGLDGKEYVRVKTCVAKGAKFPSTPGLEVVREEVAKDNGMRVEVFRPGDLGGFEAACSPAVDSGCEALVAPKLGSPQEWKAAPTGVTLQAGRWRGGCVRKPETELWRKGLSSWPAQCPGG